MTSNTLGKVVQRAISDAAFRRQLQSNPAAALRGFNLTADEAAAIRSGDPARLSALGIDQRMSKAFAFGGAADTFTRSTGNDFGGGATSVTDDVGSGTHDALIVAGGNSDSDALIAGTDPSAADAATSGASGTVGDAVTGGDPSTGDAIVSDGGTLNTGAVGQDPLRESLSGDGTAGDDAAISGSQATEATIDEPHGSYYYANTGGVDSSDDAAISGSQGTQVVIDEPDSNYYANVAAGEGTTPSDAFLTPSETSTHDLVLTGDEGSVDFVTSPDSIHDLVSSGDTLINDATGSGDALVQPDDGSALGGNDIPA